MPSNFPASLDDDSTLPPAYDNIVEVGAEAIQAIRAALFAVEANIGLNAQGTLASFADRFNVSFDSNGVIKPAALIGAGLISLPITNSQISATANIAESKLALTYTTQFLHDLWADLENRTEILEGLWSTIGVKINPHIAGTDFRHKLSAIDVDAGTLTRVDISTGTPGNRNLTNAYTFTSQFSNDFLSHVRADGINDITTPPKHTAHNASGIFIDGSHFQSIPETIQDLQTFSEYVDASSLALLGSRTQNLYANGIPRVSRCTSLVNSFAGEAILDPTPAQTFLLHSSSVNPVDDIDHGDNVILLVPNSGPLSTNNFDAQFGQVKSGDYITVIYADGYNPITFTVDSTRKYLNGTSRVYVIRINGKNILEGSTAVVRIDRPFYHDNKFNSLALSSTNNTFAQIPSLIVGSARGATALGIGFDPNQIQGTHYNLYLAIYPTGNPAQKTKFLPAIDVSGNLGTTPGAYTLDSVIQAINDAVRQPGYNYRLNAFSYKGQLGLAVSDHYNDISFSIIAGVTDTNGSYTTSSNASYPQNVIDNFNSKDALGLGVNGSGQASPPFATSYTSPLSSLVSPTLVLAPTRRNFFYVNGVEKDNFELEPLITRDGYGDGYWNAVLTTRTPLSGRTEVVYEIDLDLSDSGLQIGKTLVIQPAVSFTSGSYNEADYGRFIISNVVFTDCPGPMPITTITVYDGIHGTGVSPAASSVNIPVCVYFTGDSISFSQEHVSDASVHQTFKRNFEAYIDTDGKTWTHERARFNTTGANISVDPVNGFVLYGDVELATMNLHAISPKLRGYVYGEYKKITLFLNSFDSMTGAYDGYLCKFDFPGTYTKIGNNYAGKKGEKTKFYDVSNVDYIEVSFDLTTSLSSFTNKKMDIQLYETLQLNQEKMFLGLAQLNDSAKTVSKISDGRQFGNVSETQFSTSALNYISAAPRFLNENGVFRGLGISSTATGTISIFGGAALVNGKVVEVNDQTLKIPVLNEIVAPAFTVTLTTVQWFVCLNETGEFVFIADTDYALDIFSNYGSLPSPAANHNRIFYVKNPNAPATLPYAVPSGYLQKILLNNPELLPLYKVQGTTGLSGPEYILTSATSTELLRYIDRGNGGLGQYFTLGKHSSFRSIATLNAYLGELTGKISYFLDKVNAFSSNVYVRDSFDVSGLEFNYPAATTFYGEGGSFTVSTSSPALAGNVRFKDLTFNVSAAIGVSIEGDNVGFDNCTFNYTYDASVDVSFNGANLGNPLKACVFAEVAEARLNISVENCTFTATKTARFPFISFPLTCEDGLGSENFLQNVSIKRNIFNTITGGDTDKRAVLMICDTYTGTVTGNTGIRLINCEISENISNLDTLYVISGTEISNTIISMLVPINVVIEKNIVGAICYLTQEDLPTTYRDANKNNALTIRGNNCKLIYCGTSKGFINIVGSTKRVIYDLNIDANLYSGSANIEDNVCSWIQVGVRNPIDFAFETPVLNIENNRILADDPTFLTSYYSGIAPVHIGLIVDSVTGT